MWIFVYILHSIQIKLACEKYVWCAYEYYADTNMELEYYKKITAEIGIWYGRIYSNWSLLIWIIYGELYTLYIYVYNNKLEYIKLKWE